MLLTARDRELVEWIGRFGAVEAEQVKAWFGMGRTATYRRLRACVGVRTARAPARSERRAAVLRRDEGWARVAGLGEFEPCRVSISLVRHAQASASAAVVLALREPGMSVVDEREIRAAERFARWRGRQRVKTSGNAFAPHPPPMRGSRAMSGQGTGQRRQQRDEQARSASAGAA